MKLRCIIVDDEPLARKVMEEYVNDISFLQHCSSLENALVASGYMATHAVDLIILDIRMPKLSGLDFLKNLTNPPLAIFVTAYPDHALESYELDVIDYLVKPVSFERFQRAAHKALKIFSWRQKLSASQKQDYFFLKCDHKFEKITYGDILYVEAMQNYCIIHLPGRKLISYITLTSMREKLPVDGFLKVHKSYIVSLERITAIDGNDLVISTTSIPVGRSFKDEVMEKLLNKSALKR
jgi:DNA-binding LytR/AlgR family response regulator